MPAVSSNYPEEKKGLIRQLAISITIIACYTFDVFCQRMTENGLDRSSVTG
jgi:hypothetical protein